MAKFQVDPSSESSSGQGNGPYCTSMLCTRCVELRNLPDSNSNTTSGLFGSGLFGQPKSDKPDSKLDAPGAGFETRFGSSSCNPSIPCSPPTQQSARCDTCHYYSCICPKNDKPESSANASAPLFGTSQFGARCKTCNRSFCLCPKDKKLDSTSDAPAARSEASPCTGDIPLSQRKWTFCTKCYSHFCPNATTTVGPPLCPTCRKLGCLGGLQKPGAFGDPHRSLFTSGSPKSHGLPKGDKPDFKLDALDAKHDTLDAKFAALDAKLDACGAKLDVLLVHFDSMNS
ncbi:unnamed protein product [Clonostachys rosea f. rosea IK726]|uniref:Uncharacterized protein n=1 Tax=Clonostachys rosea f. rosea IK726 TaxID=1349383 RepID=A0ACA9T9G4_BIOOC|nr:unnamed protein product [Clonostachys rosea f. rosea IK726]